MDIAKVTFFSNGSVSGNNTDLINDYLKTQVSKFSPVQYYASDWGSMFDGPAGSPEHPPYAIGFGKPSPIPLPPPLVWNESLRPCNPNFATRKRSGEIVMSDMFVKSGLITVDTPAATDVLLSDAARYRSVSLLFIDGFTPYSGNSPWADYKNPWGGFNRGLPNAFYQYHQRTYFNADEYPQNEIKDTVDASFDTSYDGALIQSVLAEANQGTLDLLTYMAELPETYRWILDIFRKCRSTINEFRKRDFALSEATRRRQQSLRQRLLVLQNMLEKDNPSPAQRAKISRDMKKLNQDLTRSFLELGNKVSSLWLQFRYALMPQIYSIRDALKINLVKPPEYRKFRKRDQIQVSLKPVNGWHFAGDCVLTKRCLIKRAIDPNISFRGVLRNAFGGNVLNTLWELKRFSFVWDWFISTGDLLKATFSSASGVVGEVSTFSTRLSVNGYYEHPTGGRIHVLADYYKRDLIHPSNFLGLYFKPEMNWKRQLDALALFVWPALRKTLR